MIKHKDKLITLGLFLGAFGYYYLLSAKTWTWMFASFDSGDWLAASQIWFVPQPYGSPLYILLGHGINWFSSDLPLAMTLILSVLPASITVSIVFLSIKKLGYETRLALIGAGVLLACGIFLSQATVLEEYAIASMFIALAFYFYIPIRKERIKGEPLASSIKTSRVEKRNMYIVALCLALGSAVHIIVVPITVLWLIVHLREWRKLVKPVALYIGICAGFYSMILYLMASDAPNIIAGNLSFQSINDYLGSTETIGRISLHDTPERLVQMGSVLLLGFGVCLVPLVWGFTKPWSNLKKVMLLTVVFCAWLYATNTDMTTWTFTVFAIPIACVAIVIGLSKMSKWYSRVVVVWIVGMLIVNGVWLNANVLSRQKNEPELFYKATVELPDNSAIICSKGGAYGLGVIHVMSDGKDIVPLFLQTSEGYNTQGYVDYINWVKRDYQIEGEDWKKQARHCIDSGEREVYICYSVLPPKWKNDIDNWFKSEEYNSYYRRVVEAYEYPHIILD